MTSTANFKGKFVRALLEVKSDAGRESNSDIRVGSRHPSSACKAGDCARPVLPRAVRNVLARTSPLGLSPCVDLSWSHLQSARHLQRPCTSLRACVRLPPRCSLLAARCDECSAGPSRTPPPGE